MTRLLTAFLLFSFTPALPALADNDRDVVKVNGTPIRQSEVVQRLLERYGEQTIDEMVNELLLRQELAAKKVTAPPEEVERRLKKIRSEFSDEDALKERLEQRGSSLDKLKKDVADSLATERLIVKERRIAVGDEELKKAFNEHKNELGAPEAVHLRHILVKTKADGEAILKQLEGGDDFTKLAKEKSLAPSAQGNGGDDGFVVKGVLPADLEQAAFAMKAGERRIVAAGKAYNVVEAGERRKAVPAEFSKVKDDLKEMMIGQKVKEALPELVDELRRKATIEPQGR